MVSNAEESSLESRKAKEIFLYLQSALTNSGDNQPSYSRGTGIYLSSGWEGRGGRCRKVKLIYVKSNETQTWCNTVQVLFLQSHSTCFGRKRLSSGVFKTSTAATGTCVIVAGKSSHLIIRAENTNLMQHCAGFISAESLYVFRAQAPIIRSI